MSTGVFIGDVTVFDFLESETWSSSMFNQRLLKKYGDDLIKAISVDTLKQSTEVTNELFDAII